MFSIIHEIKNRKNFNLLCTCPICLKSLIQKNNLLTNDVKLLEYDKQKLLIEDNFDKGNDEYEIICPHCKTFSITYVNKMNNMRHINEEWRLEDE